MGDAGRLESQGCPQEGHAHPRAGCARLSALVMRRAALVEPRKAAMTRQKQSRLPELACLEARIIAFVTREIAKLEATIQATIAAEEAFSVKARLLRSIPSVGSVLTALLLARMPELGLISDKQAAALVGVAPMANDSGKRQGPTARSEAAGAARSAASCSRPRSAPQSAIPPSSHSRCASRPLARLTSRS